MNWSTHSKNSCPNMRDDEMMEEEEEEKEKEDEDEEREGAARRAVRAIKRRRWLGSSVAARLSGRVTGYKP